jgi:hypothetical protein
MNRHRIYLHSGLFALTALIYSSTGEAQDRPPWAKDVATEVHALIVYSSDASGTNKDAAEIERVLHKTFREPVNFPASWPRVTLNLTKLKDATKDDVLQHYGRLRVDGKSTVMFFYAGHGGTNSRGHYLALPAERLYRDELRTAMLARGGRLTVLITDCCATYTDGRSQLKAAALKWKVLYGLLARHSGVVDVNSALPGTSAWGDLEGGVFTRALTHLFCEAPTEIGGTKDYVEGLVPWRVFAPHLEKETLEAYRKYRDDSLRDAKVHPDDKAVLLEQKTQLPEFRELPPLKLGLELTQGVSSEGLVVRTVVSGLPASIAGLMKDDVVVEIAGKRVTKEAEYAQIVDSFTGQSIRFRILRGGVSRNVEVFVQL